MWPRLLSLGLATALVIGAVGAPPAAAVPVTTNVGPAGGWDIIARARNGRNGFELAFQDPAVANRNAPGAPAWSYGDPHHFELSYSGATGALSFSVDFTRNGTFEPAEILTHTFGSFAGYGFTTVGLFIQGNATGNTQVNNLTINGTDFGSFGFTANSVIEQAFTETSGGFRDVLISGDLILSGSGGSDERPRMWLRLGGEVSLIALPDNTEGVPEPVSLGMFGLGFAGLFLARRWTRGRDD
jgi:hypothetical protein